MKKQQLRLAVLCLLLVACSQFPVQAGVIIAINHTKWAINRFSVDDQPGIDIIGPYQDGGGGCCYRAPEKWKPGMTVRVDWETGVAYSYDFPGYENWEKYLAWREKIDAQKRQHSKVVPVPDYTGQRTCGITVHFLPCDQVKVTTSCNTYGSPNYPIKEPLKMKEPKVCPK
ncbi:DUF3304 domain-containing protein [Photorhabdus luminescens]|uniref:DUF3304 domain-containing protein n=1 Tax=Photorhabdus luminescens subsp. sonorensis TaxID=1173677 RepID=A0A5C4RDF3_PHOLU|nr:DUF3304 domain-containing protein [Photorhabdus luminescens]TNH41677.1 DUF3304 domain-containing protein [Photorhabdus luminescens subsp. sonorensis]